MGGPIRKKRFLQKFKWSWVFLGPTATLVVCFVKLLAIIAKTLKMFPVFPDEASIASRTDSL